MRTVLLSIAVAGALAGCSAESAVKNVPLVRTMVVGSDKLSQGASYTGVVRARIESDLGFRVGGRIVERLVDPGQSVRRGQALFRLDAGDLVLSASAAASQVDAAKAAADRTSADLARLQGLVEAGAISATQYDAALSARDAAAATLAATRAQAAEAARQRGYATLHADADGIVTDVLAQPGQVVSAGVPIVRLAQHGPREAMIAVPETALAGLPRKANARLYASADLVPASLREVAGAADPATRTFAARYVLGGQGAKAPLGSTVSILVKGPEHAAVEVPLAALYDPGSGPGVWIVRRNRTVAFQRVDLLRMGDETALVEGRGLGIGVRFVSLGAHLLREGQAVRLAQAQGPLS